FLVTVPVVLVRSIGDSAAMTVAFERQSRLVAPKTSFGDVPFTSQAKPLSRPVLHVPPRMPSFGVPSPRHRGHGRTLVRPEKMRQATTWVLAPAPVSTSVVPVNE